VCLRCETPFDEMGEDVDLALPRPAAPSQTQSHGTLMAALMSGFVLLALLLWLSVRGVGPFTASVVETQKVGDKAQVTITVTNKGDKAGHGKCRIQRINESTGDQQPPHNFLSQRVPGHGTVTQTVEVDVAGGLRTGYVSC
jgi:hypothetical protein